MVRPIYLFIGEDSPSKDIKLARLKQEFLPKDLEKFNLDIFYAKELGLHALQERLLALPLKAKKRIIVIKDAAALKEDLREFLLKFSRKPSGQIILVLDINRYNPKDKFIAALARYAEVCRFRESSSPDTFSLCRQIELRRPDYALRLLSQLLKNGNKPEWILGGLRYSLERNIIQPLEKRKRLKLLLDCDLEIKTGRLKALFALEKLVVKLACLGKPSG